MDPQFDIFYNNLEALEKGTLIYARLISFNGDIWDTLQRYAGVKTKVNNDWMTVYGEYFGLEIIKGLEANLPKLEYKDSVQHFYSGQVLKDYAFGKKNIEKAMKKNNLHLLWRALEEVFKS
jgi:hypothetical protein